MKSTAYWFTLVELIVVIAVLWVLATLSFIAIQGFSQSAKNSKVATDITSLAASISNDEIRSNVAMQSYMRAGSSLSGSNDVAGDIWDWVALSSTNYGVGYINYAQIRASVGIQDNEDREYIYAHAVNNTWKYFQIAWEVSQASWENRVFVKWNYATENPYGYIEWLISARGASAPLKDNDLMTISVYKTTT